MRRQQSEVCDSQFPFLESLSNGLGLLFVGMAGEEKTAGAAACTGVPPDLPPPQPFKLPKYGQQAADKPAAESRPALGPSERQVQRQSDPSPAPRPRHAGGTPGGLAASVEKGSGGVETELRGAEATLRAFASSSLGKELNPEELREGADLDCQQLVDLIGEEMAIEEYLVGLDDLLAARKISLENLASEVREMSRRRFMCRALRQKVAASIAHRGNDSGVRRVLNMGT